MSSSNDLSFWLALLRAPSMSYKTFHQIKQHFPNLTEFFKLNGRDFTHLGISDQTLAYLQKPDWHKVELDLRWQAKSQQHAIITINHADYPTLLKNIDYPPPLLFVNGDLAALNAPQIAIVGARKASPGGKKAAYEFARD